MKLHLIESMALYRAEMRKMLISLMILLKNIEYYFSQSMNIAEGQVKMLTI